jgi:hypothetical protein
VSPRAQLDAFIAKFDPANQRLIRELRDTMRRRVPRAHELVYDNYNFLVIVWCPSERVSDAYFSFGADAHGVNLFFGYNGTKLPDPKGLLRGTGKLNRFVRLESAKHLASRDVQALVSAAIEASSVASDGEAEPKLIIKTISLKQRPRRLAEALRAKGKTAKPKGKTAKPKTRSKARTHRS